MHIGDSPDDCGVDRHEHVVCGGSSDLLHDIALHLARDKLPELPVPVIEKICLSSIENLLLPVVLRDRSVAFVDGDQGQRPQKDHVIVEVESALVDDCRRPPLMHSGRQENWLPLVECETNEPLLDHHQVPVSVHDLTVPILFLPSYQLLNMCI